VFYSSCHRGKVWPSVLIMSYTIKAVALLRYDTASMRERSRFDLITTSDIGRDKK